MNEAGPSERAASPLVVWTGTFIAALTIAQQVASKAIRDGLFLSEFEVTSLPYVVSTGAAISFASAIVVGRAMSRRSPAVVVPSLFVMQACAFLLESLALSHYPRVTAAVLYLHTAAFGGAVVSGFWSVINERFDPYTARKVIGRIAGGATVGGMVGGGLTWALSDFSSQSLLRLLFAANLLAALLVARLARGGRRSAAGRVPLLDGFRVLARFGYPRMIAALVFVLALSITLIDYVFKASVADARSGPELVSFFAVFYAATGISTFAVQLLATRPLLRSLGVVQTAALLPLLALVFLAVCVVSPTMGTLVLLQGLIMTVENSLFRSSYELLYTPIPKKQKRSAKILIDLGVDRLGTAAGSALALLTIAALGTQMSRALLLDAALLAVAALVVLGFLRRQYVATLATQIRASFGDEGEGVWSDVHVGERADLTWAPAASTSGDSRAAIVQAVRDRAVSKRQGAEVRSVPSLRPPQSTGVSQALLDTPLRERLRASAGGVLDVAWDELRRTAPAVVGQLTDLLLSSREALETRLLAAELLATAASPRSVDALRLGLGSSQFRVRRACALALLRITRRQPALRPPKRMMIGLASAELRRSVRVKQAPTAFERTSPFRADAQGNAISATLELVLLLLALVGRAEDLQLALAAVTSRDEARRGSGLEYLDNLLPDDMRARILALVESPERIRAERALSPALLSSLGSRLRAREINVRELREEFSAAQK